MNINDNWFIIVLKILIRNNKKIDQYSMIIKYVIKVYVYFLLGLYNFLFSYVDFLSYKDIVY